MREVAGDRWRILVGDVRERLADIPDASVHACVTSPPFWALRDYGTGTWEGGDPECDHKPPRSVNRIATDSKQATNPSGDTPYRDMCGKCGARRIDRQLGSEATPEEFVANLVGVFRELRRVLRDDGVVWCELGSSYAADGNDMMMPHRVAIALQADGWTIRQTVCWVRKSPMPESVSGVRWTRCRVKVKGGERGGPNPDRRDGGGAKRIGDVAGVWCLPAAQWSDCPGCERCLPNNGYVLRRGRWRHTSALSYVFMLTRGGDYFCDGEAAKEGATSTSGGACVGKNGSGTDRRVSGAENAHIRSGRRNPRNYLLLSSEPLRLQHFAAYPPTLVHRLLLPCISKAGCCPTCGEQWGPVVESKATTAQRENWNGNAARISHGLSRPGGFYDGSSRVLEYRPTCTCPPAEPVPPTVLDCFSGSGTTGLVANYLGANYIGIELNPAYAAMAAKRLAEGWVPRERRTGKPRPLANQRTLF